MSDTLGKVKAAPGNGAPVLVQALAEGLKAAGFTIVDQKPNALLVDAGGVVKLMVGVSVCK